MRKLRPVATLAALTVFLAAPAGAAPGGREKAVAAAIQDPGRPAADRARDLARKPAEMMAFMDLKPGDQVADYLANSGYFTRLFAGVVGPAGHVYAVELDEVVTYPNVAPGYAALKPWAASRSNVTVQTGPAKAPLNFPGKLDVFWISQNYHDLHDAFLGPLDTEVFNRQVYEALRPGGIYIVLDHAAAPGAPPDVTETLHRIEPETVIREVEAAGFRLVARSRVLENPADPHTIGVFDPKIAGHTDQFILKFRRPL